MPRQNRVTPLGDLIADPARGLVYGNRGCLHDDAGRIRRRYNGKRWIACRLRFRGWHREPLMQPGRFTELFFLDEATAFAAGHRPCALCRREDYDRFVEIWRRIHPGQTGADAIDAQLHGERLDPDTRAHNATTRRRSTNCRTVRSSSTTESLDWCAARNLLRWTPSGYAGATRRPSRAQAVLITPPSSVEVLRNRLAACGSPAPPVRGPSLTCRDQRTSFRKTPRCRAVRPPPSCLVPSKLAMTSFR